MYRKKFRRFLSTVAALAMVFTLFTPMNASANTVEKPFKQQGTSEGIMQMKAAIAQQEQLLKQRPSLHQELQGLKGNESVNVIIHLSEDAVALAEGKSKLKKQTFTASDRSKALSKVKEQQNKVKKELNAANLLIREGFSYETVLNGFAATVKAGDLEKLLAIKGITLVEPDTEVFAQESTVEPGGSFDTNMDTSIPFLGIENIWNKGFKGTGIKVGVLDTGIDYHHPDFAGIYKGGWNFVPHTGSTYTRPRADNDPYETTPIERPSSSPEFNDRGNSFYTSHGTHVAGTIAAIGANEYGIKGIAPQVDLHAYRVLGAYGSGSNSGVIAGINKAVEEGMDIINLSLGGGTNTSVTADTIAINNAMLAGTLAVLSTGNSGPGRGTIGTPGAAALGLAVGNSTNPETIHDANVSVKAGSYSKTSTIKLMGTTFGVNLGTQLAGEFDIVAVPGFGKPTDYNGLNVAGKAVLVSRGDIAFVDKIAAAKDAGAAVMLIHNFGGGSNAPGPADVFLGDDFEFIPAFDMSQTEGDALRTALASASGKVSFANFNNTKTAGDEVSSSSSRGPTTPLFDIKPDVVAPGTNIMSSIPMYAKDNPGADYSKAFTRKSGTSMAAPHISGIAALIMNANPDWTPFDVKVAISNTAKILDTTKYDVFAQGPGRVQPYEAAFPKALAYAEDRVVSDGVEVDNHKGTITFGILERVKDEDISVTKQIRVKNLAGNASNFQTTVQVTKAFKDAKVTIDKPSFTLNGEQLLNVTLTASKTSAVKGDELLGYINITDGVTKLSLPFAADFSPSAPATGMADFALTETDLSFNGDGVKDVGRLEFTLLNNVATNYIELWDIMDPDGGEYGDGYIGYLHASNSLAAGSYFLDIKGQYRPWDGSPATTIPDGIYTVDFSGLNLGTGPTVIEAWDGPLFVKSTSATIEAEQSHVSEKPIYAFSGTIVDKYIEYQEELDLYDLGYNINTKLVTTYEAENEAGDVVSSGLVNLAQDGSFTVEVTGLEDGVNTVTIFVDDAAGNNAEKSFEVAYEAPEQSVLTLAVTPENLELVVGDTDQLVVTATLTDGDGNVTNTDVSTEATYSGYDEEVITVTEGNVAAVGKGTTTITVAYEGLEQTVKVNVSEGNVDPEPGKTISVTPNSVSLKVGDSEQLAVTLTVTDDEGVETETDVTTEAAYSGYDEEVITVTEGNVVAVGKGTTTITVAYEGLEQTVEVNVSEGNVDPEPGTETTLSVSPDKVSLYVGDTKQLVVTSTVTDEEGADTTTDVTEEATYGDFNDKVITVKNGMIQAVGVGETAITVSHGDLNVTVNVTVSNYTQPPYVPPVTPPVDPKPVDPKPITPPAFTDIGNTFAEKEINKLAAIGIVQGKSETIFAPNAQISRAEFAVMLARALDLPLKDYEGKFSDVGTSKKWAYAGVEAAARAGIVNGKLDGSFDPDAPIKREEIAAMSIRAIEYMDKAKLASLDKPDNYKDHGSIGAFAIESVYKATALGVIKGNEGNFNPKNNATRAEAVVILYRTLETLKMLD